jgi:hypothetical protein
MSLTKAQARDEILSVLNEAWDATDYPMLFEDLPAVLPKNGPWARTSVRHVDGEQATLSGGLGLQKFKRSGFITVQIFSPSGDGLSLSDSLIKIVMDAFEGKATSGGVWFRNVRSTEVGPDGNFFQVNVTIDFEYTELK